MANMYWQDMAYCAPPAVFPPPQYAPGYDPAFVIPDAVAYHHSIPSPMNPPFLDPRHLEVQTPTTFQVPFPDYFSNCSPIEPGAVRPFLHKRSTSDAGFEAQFIVHDPTAVKSEPSPPPENRVTKRTKSSPKLKSASPKSERKPSRKLSGPRIPRIIAAATPAKDKGAAARELFAPDGAGIKGLHSDDFQDSRVVAEAMEWQTQTKADASPVTFGYIFDWDNASQL